MDGQGYFLVLLILSIISSVVFPVRVVSMTWTLAGIPLIAVGFILAWRSRSLFLENSTTLSPYGSPAFLITTGPFRISRNPIYLAMALSLLGVATLLGTLLPFVFVFLLVGIIGMLFIPDEEQRLETRFGSEYMEYKKHVRRWL
jgi:protein-S-isoprenylcysteine O-methyltransferase Ste14